MCGRYAITLPPEAVRAWFGYAEQPNFPPRFNVAPTQPIPIVCRDPLAFGAATRHFRLVRWGLLPAFVKTPGDFPLLINARAEGIVDKPSFRAAMIRRRCLVIADGYYEWRRPALGKPGTPFLFRRSDGRPIGFAGLWESWLGADGSELDTACIITTVANGATAAVHPRMPVMLEPAAYDDWLDGDGVRPAAAARLLRPAPDDALRFVEIGPAVNKVSNDDATLQDAVGPVTEHRPTPPVQGSLF